MGLLAGHQLGYIDIDKDDMKDRILMIRRKKKMIRTMKRIYVEDDNDAMKDIEDDKDVMKDIEDDKDEVKDIEDDKDDMKDLEDDKDDDKDYTKEILDYKDYMKDIHYTVL